MLSVAGGKERMLHALTPEAIADAGLPSDPERLAARPPGWHAYKSEIFRPHARRRRDRAPQRRAAAGGGSPRGGLGGRGRVDLGRGLGQGGHAHDPGPELSRDVEVLAGDVVAHKKPAPDIYLEALARLGVPAAGAVAIEDSRNGLLAAVRAGIACVITRSAFTQQEPMDEATIVLSELGDPGLPAPRVDLNRTRAAIDGPLTLPVLEAFLRQDQGKNSIP